jgi:hypothetical protein
MTARSFRAVQEGYDVTFRADDGTRRIEEPIYNAYLNPDDGGRETIVVRPDGTISFAHTADLSLIVLRRF